MGQVKRALGQRKAVAIAGPGMKDRRRWSSSASGWFPRGRGWRAGRRVLLCRWSWAPGYHGWREDRKHS